MNQAYAKLPLVLEVSRRSLACMIVGSLDVVLSRESRQVGISGRRGLFSINLRDNHLEVTLGVVSNLSCASLALRHRYWM